MSSSCKLLIIGGSAGSIEIIMNLMPLLRPDLSFPVVIVLHRRSGPDNILTELLASKTKLKVKEAEEKDPLLPGNIYLAPADYHLLIEKDRTLSLDFSEKVNYSRPSIDVTFETAAEACGSSVTCILLSGASSDGTEGLKIVKRYGGKAVVQDPLTAEVAYMPEQAIAGVDVDQIIHTADIAGFVNNL